jgi:hypothetical protein
MGSAKIWRGLNRRWLKRAWKKDRGRCEVDERGLAVLRSGTAMLRDLRITSRIWGLSRRVCWGSFLTSGPLWDELTMPGVWHQHEIFLFAKYGTYGVGGGCSIGDTLDLCGSKELGWFCFFYSEAISFMSSLFNPTLEALAFRRSLILWFSQWAGEVFKYFTVP